MFKKSLASLLIVGALITPIMNSGITVHAKEVACTKEQQAFKAIKQNREEIEDKISRLTSNISTLTANEENIRTEQKRLSIYISERKGERKAYQEYLDYLNGLPEVDKGSDWERSRGAAMRTIERLSDHIKTAENRTEILKENLRTIQTQLGELRSKLRIQRNNLEYAISEYDKLNQELILCLNKPGNIPNKHHWDNLPKQGNDIPISNGENNGRYSNGKVKADERENGTAVIRYVVYTPRHGDRDTNSRNQYENADKSRTNFIVDGRTQIFNRTAVEDVRNDERRAIPMPPKIKDITLPKAGTESSKLLALTIGSGILGIIGYAFCGRKKGKHRR